MGTKPTKPQWGRRAVASVVVVVAAILVSSGWAGAHTGFGSSSPADGEVVVGPVTEIVVVFTAPVTPVGEGFVVLDGDGTVQEPRAEPGPDEHSWILTFDTPIAAGEIGVRWTVQATDGHPLSGAFSFTILEPAPETTSTSTTAVIPTTTVPASTTAPESVTAPLTTVEAAPATTAEAPASERADDDRSSLEDFLSATPSTAAGSSAMARVASALTLLGALLAVGAVAFILLVMQPIGDVDGLIARVGTWAAVALIAGAAGAFATQVAVDGAAWSALWEGGIGDALRGDPGLALGLRIFGGALLGAAFWTWGRQPNAEPGRRPRQTVFPARAALVGGAAVLVSFLFDGHTLSEGPRWLHALANLIHVGAAAVWAGGLTMLALVLGRGRRRGAGAGIELVVRFSVVATAALVLVAVPGVVLAAIVLDAPSELWCTAWGRLLIGKTALVAVAGVIGGYNHFVVVPSLESGSTDPESTRAISRTVRVEAGLVLAVGLVTAFLVHASTAG